jgi:hypothetical protein
MIAEADMLVSAPSITKSEGPRLSNDEQDEQTRQWFTKRFEESLVRWWKEADAVTQADFAAYKQEVNDHRLGDFGNLVLDIPFGLANYLEKEYGRDCFQDKDFIMYLQKAVGQTFLAKI